jgi:ABC-type molybdate transport system ATPase subunit
MIMIRMKEVYILAQELNVLMENGEITMDDAVEEILCEYDVTSSQAYDILDNVMGMECEA